MGCFNSSGCISQIPIQEGQRVAGILCKIQSDLDFSDAILWNGCYSLIPMCPIIYGVYNDCGYLTPDEGSLTVKILEQFFDEDIDSVLCYFNNLTYFGGDEWKSEPSPETQKMMKLRENDEIRHKRFYNIPKKVNLNNPYNHFCLVLEHEDVVKKLIDSQDFNYFAWNYGIKNKTKATSWSEMYDEQLEIFREDGLDDYFSDAENDERVNILRILGLGYPIFPVRQQYLNVGLYNDVKGHQYFMDFLRHYPSNFCYIFDERLKDEYLDTIRFYLGLTTYQLKMYLRRDSAGQNDDREFFKSLVETYSKILNK